MRSPMRRLFIMLAAACLLGLPFAQARAGEALMLPTGGLLFAPDPAIDFEEESLFLSVSQVRATYRLRNISSSGRTILISLPLPDISMADLTGRDPDLASSANVNFIKAEAFVDGEEPDTTFEQRAIALGLDVTARLHDEGLPLGPDMSEMSTQIAAMDPDTRALMIEDGILQEEDARIKPAWTLKTVIYWRQYLPAGTPVTIEIGYRPVTGRTAYSPQRLARLKSDYCVNDPTADAIAERANRGGGSPDMSQVVYLMTAGAHWHKPTGKFRLVIEKNDQTVELATCMKGFRPLSANQLEWTASDFMPSVDYKFLFVR